MPKKGKCFGQLTNKKPKQMIQKKAIIETENELIKTIMKVIECSYRQFKSWLLSCIQLFKYSFCLIELIKQIIRTIAVTTVHKLIFQIWSWFNYCFQNMKNIFFKQA